VKSLNYFAAGQTLLWGMMLSPLAAAQTLPVPNADKLPQVSERAADLVAQENPAVVSVTGIQLQPTEGGLDIVLETQEGTTLAVDTIPFTPEGNVLIAEIPNVALVLPDGKPFQAVNPTADIAQVTVEQQTPTSIQVRVLGNDALPTTPVTLKAGASVAGTPPDPAEEEEVEITVTAEQEEQQPEGYRVPNSSVGTKTDTPLLDVPQSIQVIPREVIKDRQTSTITETLRAIPGIASVSDDRGLFTDVRTRGGSTNYLTNGLRDPLASQSGESSSSIERIEVLKGPASVLFGQGAFGGTINLVTKQPLSTPFYAVEGVIGSYDLYSGAVDLTGPLNDSKTLLYRLNLFAETSNSFVDFLGRNRIEVAPVLAWKLGKNTDLTVEAKYTRFSDRASFDVGLPARGTILDNLNGEIPLNRFAGVPIRQTFNTFQIGYNLEHRFNENWRLRNAFQFALQSLDGRSFIAFPANLLDDDRTLERSYRDTSLLNEYNYILDTNVVGKFKTGSIQHELLAGFELYRRDFRLISSFGTPDPIDLFNPNYDDVNIGPPDFNFDDLTRSDELGIYLQDKVNLLDNLILVLGGRFDIVSNKVEDFLADATTSQTNTAFSPRVGLVYKPIPEVSLYASYSRSFLQSIGRSRTGELFQPERGTQYEVGVKADITKKFSTTLALFDITRSNVLNTDPVDPNFSIQTGKENSRGVEFFASGEILPGWSVIGGYSYVDARITEDNTLPVGSRLLNTPLHSASLWTTYEIQKGPVKGLGAGLGLFYVGDRQGDSDNTFTVPGYLRTDASIFYQRNKFRVALNFRNLFDINYFTNSESDLQVRPGDPFTVVGSVSFEF
jgi:iron complex outermembrane recepter protein